MDRVPASVDTRTGRDWRVGLGLPGADDRDREWLTPEACAERLGRPLAQVLVMVAAGALRARRHGDELEVEPAIVAWPAA